MTTHKSSVSKPRWIACFHARKAKNPGHVALQPGGLIVEIDDDVFLGLCPRCAGLVRDQVFQELLIRAIQNMKPNIVK
jgi:hypothetical protein